MKLTVIFSVFNQHPLATLAIAKTLENAELHDTNILVLDNGSAVPFVVGDEYIASKTKVVRAEKNIGVYPIFWEALKYIDQDTEIVAFLHSDLIVAEKGWDKRVIEAFESNSRLALIGFVGSNEIDYNGGRGLGTTSNFQGGTYSEETNPEDNPEPKTWISSPAEAHGKRNVGISKAAVVDGCAMIFRREVLESIDQRPDYPPHHFYDRLLSCEVQERGWEVAVLGIACDHISGQTVNQEQGYHDLAKEWCQSHLMIATDNNWDAAVYDEAGRQWITEYRGIKHMVPRKVE